MFQKFVNLELVFFRRLVSDSLLLAKMLADILSASENPHLSIWPQFLGIAGPTSQIFADRGKKYLRQTFLERRYPAGVQSFLRFLTDEALRRSFLQIEFNAVPVLLDSQGISRHRLR